MMTDFEPFDDDLAIALQRRVPHMGEATLDTASAHDAVLARARGVRRRRAGIAGLVTLVAVIGGGVLLLNGNNGDDTLAPATEPSTSLAPETSAVVPSTSAVPPTTRAPETSVRPSVPGLSTTVAPPPATTPGTVLSTTPASTVAAPPQVTVGGQSTPTNPPASSTSSSSSSSSSSTSSSSSSSTSLAPQGPPPFTKSYSSAGGSITINWNGSALSLVSTEPAAGYTTEIEDNTAIRIRVRFRGATDSRIEIRYENGQVTERID